MPHSMVTPQERSEDRATGLPRQTETQLIRHRLENRDTRARRNIGRPYQSDDRCHELRVPGDAHPNHSLTRTNLTTRNLPVRGCPHIPRTDDSSIGQKDYRQTHR